MTTKSESRVTAIGQIANLVLRRSPTGLVTGKTSRGVYVQPSGDLTLYLTDEPFRGPLTVNIRGRSASLTSVQVGEVLDLNEESLSFKISQQTIHFDRPLIWKPASPPKQNKSIYEIFSKLVSRIQDLCPDHPYLPLLVIVTAGESIPIKGLPRYENHLHQLMEVLQKGNPSDILSAMDPLLGAGPGLTPLGDDILLGILLGITRTGKQSSWSGDMIHFAHSLLRAAEQKSTRLSWSLLSCAVQGAGDERIIRVLDDLIAAREIPDHDLDCLLHWGSSSGIAVLAGMMMALS